MLFQNNTQNKLPFLVGKLVFYVPNFVKCRYFYFRNRKGRPMALENTLEFSWFMDIFLGPRASPNMEGERERKTPTDRSD